MNNKCYFYKSYENLVRPLCSKVMPVFYLTGLSICAHFYICGKVPLNCKVVGDKGTSKMKSKQQRPCTNCMHWPVTSWGNACCTWMHKPVRCIHQPVRCMHHPVMSQADACTYCMESKVSSLSRIYLLLQQLWFNCLSLVHNKPVR